jgi:hypothetical protein
MSITLMTGSSCRPTAAVLDTISHIALQAYAQKVHYAHNSPSPQNDDQLERTLPIVRC